MHNGIINLTDIQRAKNSTCVQNVCLITGLFFIHRPNFVGNDQKNKFMTKKINLSKYPKLSLESCYGKFQ